MSIICKLAHYTMTTAILIWLWRRWQSIFKIFKMSQLFCDIPFWASFPFLQWFYSATGKETVESAITWTARPVVFVSKAMVWWDSTGVVSVRCGGKSLALNRLAKSTSSLRLCISSVNPSQTCRILNSSELPKTVLNGRTAGGLCLTKERTRMQIGWYCQPTMWIKHWEFV